MSETIVIEENEVGRVKLPVSVKAFAGLVQAFEKAYGPGLLFRQQSNSNTWAVFVNPKPERKASGCGQECPRSCPEATGAA